MVTSNHPAYCWLIATKTLNRMAHAYNGNSCSSSPASSAPASDSPADHKRVGGDSQLNPKRRRLDEDGAARVCATTLEEPNEVVQQATTTAFQKLHNQGYTYVDELHDLGEAVLTTYGVPLKVVRYLTRAQGVCVSPCFACFRASVAGSLV